jgi:hypothetical protein
MFKRVMGVALAVASPLTFTLAPALLVAPSAPVAARGHASSYSGTCGSDSYVNSRGNCVHRPVAAPTAPAGASAQCADGTYSFSQSRRGTCSHHGGVSRWL